MTRSTVPLNPVASDAYDYSGRRISRTIHGSPDVTIKYAYDGQQIIAEYDANDTLLRKFVYGPGIDEPICLIDVADANARYFYHCDGLGSVVALCDVNNVPVERYAYDVFGRPTIRDANGVVLGQSAFANPYLFTGRAWDAETALYYYRARYYDYFTGRFLQPDPVAMFLQVAAPKYAKREGPNPGTYLSDDSLGEFLESDPIGRFLRSDANGKFLHTARFGMPVELNLYTYCNNNPIILVDPYGLWKKAIIGAVPWATGFALLWHAATVATAPAWVIPAGVGLVAVGTALIIWDMCDEDGFVRNAVGNLARLFRKSNEQMFDEYEKYGDKECP